ncbi:MAG: Flp pilus assembly protein CpaB [Bacillota bacterium]
MKKRKSSFLLLLLAVVLALGAGGAAVMAVKSYSETVPAIVAARDIPRFTRLTAEMLAVEEVPKASLPEDVIREPGQAGPSTDLRSLLGKYTSVEVLRGDVLRRAHLAEVRGERGLMTARVSALGDGALRAFAVPYSPETAVGGEVREGDRVDIIASVKIDAPAGQVGVGKIVARNVLVLAASKPGGESSGVLVLALRPPEIEDIAFAMSCGRLLFALNPYETDEQAAVTPGVTGRSWLEKYGFETPGPPSAGR